MDTMEIAKEAGWFMLFGTTIAIFSTFIHELGHFYAAKILKVSTHKINYFSRTPHVRYQDPGEPIKDGLVYFVNSIPLHRNIILLAGPMIGSLASLVAYFAFDVMQNFTFTHELFMRDNRLQYLYLIPVGMTIFNLIPMKFKAHESDGYHIFFWQKSNETIH